MFRPLALFVGLRYTRAKRRNHFVSFISLVSILGIFLGVTALITVLSVMNGFEKEVRERILDMISHVTVTDYLGPMRDWREVVQAAQGRAGVEAAAPYVEGQGMLVQGRTVQGVMIRGIEPSLEAEVASIEEKMQSGTLDSLAPGEFGIVLGHDLARMLGADVGDKVTLVTPSANVTPAGISPRLKRFTVTGIFRVGMYEYDSALALTHLRDASVLFRMPDQVTGVRLRIDDLFDAPAISRALAAGPLDTYRVRDWSSYHSNWFRAVEMEKRMIFLLLLLIITVAAFNIVSTLVMVVTDKQSDIAILRTLGASPRTVMGIFMVQGTFIGLFGTVLGVLGGVALALNLEAAVSSLERLLQLQFVPADVYYISELPSDMHWDDVITIGLVSFLISIVATVYPAWRASRTQPAEALRYE